MIKNFLCVAFSLLAFSNTFGMGAIWVLEIEYQTNQEIKTGYVEVGFWEKPYEKYVGDGKGFTEKFFKLYEITDSIKVYHQLLNQEKIAQAATFPMHPFFLIRESYTTVPVKQINNLTLKKVWVKDAYMINVLTHLNETDIGWISGKSAKEFPIGEQVGCRLEVHNFGNTKDYQKYVTQLADLYLKKDSLTNSQQNKYKALLQKLKIRKVVVVELCGC